MLNSNLVKAAHKMAKEIKSQYPEVNYSLQFGLCLSYLLNKGEKDMENLKVGNKVQANRGTRVGQIIEIKEVKRDVEMGIISDHTRYLVQFGTCELESYRESQLYKVNDNCKVR